MPPGAGHLELHQHFFQHVVGSCSTRRGCLICATLLAAVAIVALALSTAHPERALHQPRVLRRHHHFGAQRHFADQVRIIVWLVFTLTLTQYVDLGLQKLI
jgi:hypothetical protein